MRPIMITLACFVVSLIACGDWVEVRPATAQADGGNDGAGGSPQGSGGAPQCECPAPAPPRRVQLASAPCEDGHAWVYIEGHPDPREIDAAAWVGPAADPTLGRRRVSLEWNPSAMVGAACEPGEVVEVWGTE